MKTYLRILNAIYNHPWAILPEKLDAIVGFIEDKVNSGKLGPQEQLFLERRELPSAEDVQRIVAAAPDRTIRQAGSIAILPLRGTIVHRANLISEFSGGTSAEMFSAQLRQVLADPNVKAIVIDVDSPGGSVGGIDELSTEIFKARSQKPIVAVANSLAASAAFWIASAASELVVIPSGLVGSIGVVAVHRDVSKQSEKEGVKTTLISAGKFKTEGSPFEPLADEARAHIQKLADGFMSMFVRTVARNRDVPISEVQTGFGEGRLVAAKDALRLGMVDRIGTMDETLKRLASNRPRKNMAAERRRMELAAF